MQQKSASIHCSAALDNLTVSIPRSLSENKDKEGNTSQLLLAQLIHSHKNNYFQNIQFIRIRLITVPTLIITLPTQFPIPLYSIIYVKSYENNNQTRPRRCPQLNPLTDPVVPVIGIHSSPSSAFTRPRHRIIPQGHHRLLN